VSSSSAARTFFFHPAPAARARNRDDVFAPGPHCSTASSALTEAFSRGYSPLVSAEAGSLARGAAHGRTYQEWRGLIIGAMPDFENLFDLVVEDLWPWPEDNAL
jgi:hypothetical protein